MICSCWLRAMTSYQSEIWNFVLILRRCEKTVSAEMPRRVAICLAFRPEALSVRMRCSASVSFGKGAYALDDSYSDSSDSGGATNASMIALGRLSASVLSNIVVMPAFNASVW